ncbi:TPA: baseplate J/gp47 family protein [Klebsiella pneumoniae subsp. ozaenae]|uniref:baseplate J/gp47 family protein n=1 Tax=Klebsiella/Raoultella group TaxID=2890311 RepID=UPI001F50C424|nr:baseplate J/gp47 family protein [Raoultella sp. HC6]HBT1438073.1 baseplate J/gp47 family protein [Klebsiella pneumoniae]HDS4941306.1 baseplate J/gp47 family protein [Klebsiella pneumoniae subsp. ozaenae]HDT6090098.1 baseplate J/gp47 family protein [Raoultella ornithinolytica]HBT1443862.1 baseplate J/gp47 family protein [Klebsiella pneumoniae]HBT1449671.1 baseplate J/gp47 family protein [Klebsiella pneumoniae]
MPFKRKTLSELREENRQFMQAELKNVGALLRFGNLKVLADMDAGMAHLHYAYLDYIALQTNPFTATDEWLAGWMALKQTYRKAATASQSSSVEATGTSGARLPAGTVLNRSDGYQYVTDAELIIGAGKKGTTTITAILPDLTDDSTGGGSNGNADAGTILTLDANVSGVDNSLTLVDPATGGADIEGVEDFRQRGLLAYQNPPQGGSDADYKKWALAVSGVTRAWIKRRGMGVGSVVIYIMCDGNDTTNNGFPTGTDGVSSLEDWGAIKATGDQRRVADYIYPLQADTAIIYVCSPIKKIVDLTISGIPDASSETIQAITDAINLLFFDNGNPDGSGKIYLSDVNGVLSQVEGSTGYVLESPTQNIVLDTGELPLLGEVNFT